MTRSEYTLSLCVGFISLAISVSYGIAYGMEGGNQLTYIPPGLRLIDPAFLQRDWWASETTVYHISFSYLIALLHWLHLLPWAAVVGNIFFIAATYWCIFHLIARFSDENAFAVWIIFVFLFLGVSRSQSVAASYLFDAELQASSVASAATVLAIFLFITGRPLYSGIALASGGLFHANFLVLGILCFGLAQLFLGWRFLIRRSMCQLLPSLLVLVAHAPLMLTISGQDLPPEMQAAAGRLLIEVAAPHHYQPRGFLFDFIPLVGWNTVALAMLRTIPGNGRARQNFIAIYLSLLLVITIGTVLTTVVVIDFVSRLFVWRMAPFLLICAQMTIAIAAGRLLIEGFRSRIAAREAKRGRRSSAIVIALLAVGLVIARIPIIVASTADGMTVTRNFNLLAVPGGDRFRIELYRWAGTTDRDSLFLIPPMLSGFRLHSGRAVYVDWKGRPFRPDELIEWHRRMRSITGLDRWQLDELDKAYDALDNEQIRSLVEAYKIEYVVLHKKAKNGRSLGDVVFANEVYVVVRVSDDAAGGAGRSNVF